MTSRTIIFSIYFLFAISHTCAAEDAYQENNQKRLAAVLENIEQTAQQERATLVKGTMRLLVFGPDATVALYTLAGADGDQYQYMVLLMVEPDISAGEVAPPLKGSYVELRRYAIRHVVIGQAQIGGTGERLLDLSGATVRSERANSRATRILATVTIPIVGNRIPAKFRIKRTYEMDKAAIDEIE